MNKPSLYQKFNVLTRRDAKEIIKQYKNLIQWRLDEKDILLDIGCGCGDITNDYILPIMPKKSQKVIGSDISQNMVKHARANYYKNSKISFMQMDIGADTNEFKKNIIEKVDHITSFYCLHWVQKQQNAVNNMYNLLNSNGDYLLVFLAASNIYNLYEQLSSKPKWEPYMEDVDRFISPYQYSKNPIKEFSELLYSAGFSEFNIKIRDKIFTYEGTDFIKSFLISINPFIDRMPYDIRDEYINDFITEISRLQFCDDMTKSRDFYFKNVYKLMIAYGRKSSN